MLHFEGDSDFVQSPSEIWSKLSDARFLVECIPGVETVSVSEPDQAVCVLRPGFSFVRGTLELRLGVRDREKDQAVRLHMQTKGIGTTSTVEAALNFASQESATRVHWTAEVTELGGLLKAVPQGLIKAAAQKVIADAWAAVKVKMTGA